MKVRPRQCKACPWKKTTDPHAQIPHYDEAKHRALTRCMAEPGAFTSDPTMHIMACHETKEGAELACTGWVAQQLGPGNNIPLRLLARRDPDFPRLKLDGPQHETLEETFPHGD